MIKKEGLCPFCTKLVQPNVTKTNYFRRDKCICPECNATVYVCQGIGCNNFTKGGSLYDDCLCPSCTSQVIKTSIEVIKGTPKFILLMGKEILIEMLRKQQPEHQRRDSNNLNTSLGKNSFNHNLNSPLKHSNFTDDSSYEDINNDKFHEIHGRCSVEYGELLITSSNCSDYGILEFIKKEIENDFNCEEGDLYFSFLAGVHIDDDQYILAYINYMN